ncbi:LysR family transcriptional regulator [Dactylosporangium roseum]|uniref:LysR family transcriptional regulator n=1 Tax=Dactylosporangium roseum TaxID=47989 RepID=A0ABY5YXF7_9ACTN|nr:LysR family transcriptional regulator [Dactylosporangium roseum]UWZ34446.1 LysR family transcriptional regulator [Dactylosporangium roseum]
MLELRRLRLLHLFALHGTIAAVASATGYTQSAVSQQLAVLEREVGAALLERSARSAALTAAGLRLAGHAAGLLDAAEAAEADVASAAGAVAGRVVVSGVPTAATAWAPALIAVRRAYPALDLVLRQYDPLRALDALRSREVDVALVDDWSDDPVCEPGLRRRLLLRDPLMLAGPADGDVWLCAPSDQPSRVATDPILARLGIRPATRWEFEGLATIAALVSQGVGTAVLPRLALLGTDVPAVLLDPPRHRRIDAVIRAASWARPAIAAVVDSLQAHGAELGV